MPHAVAVFPSAPASRSRRLARAVALAWSLLAATLVGAGLAAGLGGCASSPRAAGSEPLTDEQRVRYVESFDEVWRTVRDKHWDPAMGGVDWQAASDELRPRVERATTRAEARQALEDLLDRLGQSHFGIIPGELYERQASAAQGTAADAPRGGSGNTAAGEASERAPVDAASDTKNEPADDFRPGQGRLGIELRALDGRAVVFRVEPGSPAAEAGIDAGWIVRAARGVRLEERLAALERARAPRAGDSSSTGLAAGMYELTRVGLMHRLVGGDVGDAVDLELLDGRDRVQRRRVVLGPPAGVDGSVGNLVGVRAEFESRRLAPGAPSAGVPAADAPPTPDDVGYIRFSMFAAPGAIMPQFADALERFRDARGIVVDLRGNPGGVGAMAMGMGGWFVTTPNQRLGTMITRDARLNFVLSPRARPITLPLAILIDGTSASTAEILAGGLKDLGRAHIVGTTSAGAALPSVISRLPSGDAFQYAFANYVSTGGAELEGRGVEPHETVVLDRASLLRGIDPQLEAALRWIRSQAPAAQAPARLRSTRLDGPPSPETVVSWPREEPVACGAV